MARNKKRIIVYADWMDNFQELTDTELGVLFRHFFEYINDKNPVLKDRIVKVAWRPIEATLKRDLESWKQKAPDRVEKARLAGVASGEKRRELKRTKTNSLVQNEPEPTKRTVSVIIVSVSAILLKKETKKLFSHWMDYRKEIKKPIKSEKTMIALANKIKENGYEKSKEVISESIVNGWTGLFWNKQPDEKEKKVAPKKEMINAGLLIQKGIFEKDGID